MVSTPIIHEALHNYVQYNHTRTQKAVCSPAKSPNTYRTRAVYFCSHNDLTSKLQPRTCTESNTPSIPIHSISQNYPNSPSPKVQVIFLSPQRTRQYSMHKPYTQFKNIRARITMYKTWDSSHPSRTCITLVMGFMTFIKCL